MLETETSTLIVSLKVYVDLSGASLRHTSLREARLINANLSNATLIGTNLFEADLRGADFNATKVGWFSFGSNDLSFVKGLDSLDISGPIGIDVQSMVRSRNLPMKFLRAIGLPDTFLTYLPSLISEAITFDSCFISYSNEDLLFASRLYKDLRAEV